MHINTHGQVENIAPLTGDALIKNLRARGIKSARDQCIPAVVNAAAALCGCCDDEGRATAGFSGTLYDLPPFPGEFTVGDVARAYLRHVLAQLDAFAAARS